MMLLALKKKEKKERKSNILVGRWPDWFAGSDQTQKVEEEKVTVIMSFPAVTNYHGTIKSRCKQTPHPPPPKKKDKYL